MKMGILHEELEWTEKELERIFLQKFHSEVSRFDIRETNLDKILSFNPDIVLNRVYASVGNRNYFALSKTLTLLEELEDKGIITVNNYDATKSDYSKFFAYQKMVSHNIPTPKTFLVEGNEEPKLDEVLEMLEGFPIIVKRDSGGRGFDLAKVKDKDELRLAIAKIEDSYNYKGKIILQQFIQPIGSYDYRVCVVDGRITYAHGRTLIFYQGEEPWLASASLGSVNIDIKNTPLDLEHLAISSANSIGAILDTIDIIKTNKGYSVIEHNPTPQLTAEWESQLGFSPTARFADAIYKKYRSEKI